MFRLLDGSSVADADAVMNALITYFDDLIVETAVTGVEFANTGSDIFNPMTGSTVVGTSFGSTVANPANNAVAATLIGRSSDGRRARLSMFGWFGAVSDYRVTVAEDADLAILLAFMNDDDTPLITIGGLGVIYKQYIDIKANDHWVAEARS
jgi:hypothetical protein